ncbi:GMP reductase [Salpingoeca rosetta]|uniref:GMP reductase n=1 Tax=Salpingoeca rosetta (strain ATCC 50818 / BSB-021) TaxID=946362 RepID=F2UI21_SALR5|nr:GMP reductase [Salpingoeca rosetta]EGD76770.1 GMP reductase [Salpingoeca rosetta]|eukprot:XP_004991142.1 GMP reductase [Salpingoeca rosetta]
MRIEADVKLDYKDVLIRPKRSTLRSRAEVDLDRKYTFLHSKKTWTGVPIVAANMDTTGTFEAAQVMSKHKMLVAASKHYEAADWQAQSDDVLEFMCASSGTGKHDFATLATVLETNPAISFICLDVANGYSEHFVDFVKKVREAFPDKTIMAGNVVTQEMVEELILSGADIVKVGIGPGSVCTTRKQTGVGYPQLSAVIECADAAHGLGGHIVADGGCTCPGDIAKAFGAGADFVMLGGMLAGHDESAGELVEKDKKFFKMFYGMSSDTAMKKHHGSVADYRASEGKTITLPYRGPLEPTLKEIMGSLRSACTYVGAAKLKEISKRTTFIRVTQQRNLVFEEHDVKSFPVPERQAKTPGEHAPADPVDDDDGDGDGDDPAAK